LANQPRSVGVQPDVTDLDQRPPGHPNEHDAPEPPGPAARRGPETAAVWTVVGIVAIALAAGAGGVVWFPRDGDIDQGAALGRGLLFGVAGGVVSLVAALVARRRYALPGALLIGLVVVACSLATMLGVATAPPTTDAAPDPPPSAEPPGSGPDPGGSEVGNIPFAKTAAASFVDADGDGRADLDAGGDPIIAFDADGDGTFERRLVRCPDSTAAESRGDPAVRLDLGCDGSIDGTVPLRADMLDEVPTGGAAGEAELVPVNPDLGGDSAPSSPDGQSGEDANDGNTSDSGSGLGVIARVLLTLLAVAVLAVAAAVIVRLLRSRSRPASWSTDDPDDDGAVGAEAIDTASVDAALEDSIETLLGHRDPRLAIRAAYAVLLDALAESGLARRSSEAPDEHLSRCLTALAIEPGPLRELLRLFALARFSTHPITESDRAAALGALRASQDLLRSRADERGDRAPGWAPPVVPR